MTDENHASETVTPTPDTLIAFGHAVKSIGDGTRVGGYLAVWGDPEHRDLQREYFTPETDFRLDLFPVRPAFYDHTLDPELQDMTLGMIDTIKADSKGLWAEATLDMERLSDPDTWEAEQRRRRKEYMQRIRGMVERGELQWSSGALPHLVKTASDGQIIKWPIFEGSLTPTPAEPIGTGITSIKAIMRSEMSLIEPTTAEGAVAPTVLPIDAPGERQKAETPVKSGNTKGASKMDSTSKIEIVQALAAEWGIELTADQLAAAVAMLEGSNAADLETVTAPDADVASPEFGKAIKAIAEATAAHITRETMNSVTRGDAVKGVLRGVASAIAPTSAVTAPANSVKRHGSSLPMPEGLQMSGRVSVGENLKYAHLSAADMIFGAQLMAAKYNREGRPGLTLQQATGLSDDYITVMTHKASRAAEEQARNGNYTMKSLLPFKADELNATNIAGQGAEWVGEAVGLDLWETPRPNRIWDRMVAAGMPVRVLADGEGSYPLASEGTDPIVYSPPEANDLSSGMPEITVKQSPVGTGEASVTPGKIGARVIVSVELIEDSMVPVIPQMRRQMTETLLDHRDKLFLNGDTVITGSTNINLIDGTPGTGDARPYYLAANGLRKYALVTNASTQAVDAGGANDLSLWRLARSLLRDAYRENPDSVMFITNILTHDSTLAYPELATFGTAQQYATINAGVVDRLYRVQIVGSSHLPLANTAGKVSATPANNVTGTILAVYPGAIVAVVKRDITIKQFEYIRSDAMEFVATARVAYGFRDTKAVGAVYNVGNGTSVL